MLSGYQELKKANPAFPILVRECSGVEAKLIARYGEEEGEDMTGACCRCLLAAPREQHVLIGGQGCMAAVQRLRGGPAAASAGLLLLAPSVLSRPRAIPRCLASHAL